MSRQLLVFTCVIILAIGALFLWLGAKTPHGAFVLPLDDAYIHLQYSWQLAQGKFWQYNSGDLPTTGGTSLLYMLVLAVFFALGVSKTTITLIVLLLGWFLFGVSTSGLMAVARELARQLEVNETLAALLVLSLFAGSGWMAWAFFSGMETGLLITLVVGVLWSLTFRREKLLCLFASLAVLTRPEAVLLALAVALITVTSRGKQATGTLLRVALAVSPLIVAGFPYLINFALTGSWLATGWLAKSWFTLVPLRLDFVRGEILKTILSLSVLWLAISFTFIERRVLWVSALWVASGVLATATLQTATWHHNRYQMPLYPAVVVLCVTGVVWLAKRFSFIKFAPLFLLVWNYYSLTDYMQAYALDTRTVLRQQMVLADWVKTNLPAGSLLATHDVGVIKFLGERDTLDVVGLTTNGMAAANRNGPGSLYEALARAQPNYYAVYPNVAPPYFGLETAPALFGEKLFAVTYDSFSGVTSAGATQAVFKPNWATMPLASQPQQPNVCELLAPLKLVDSLNVADLTDENNHAHDWQNKTDLTGFASDARQMHYRYYGDVVLADGGRIFNGDESFVFRTTPQQNLILVSRVHQTADMILRVRVNNQDAGEWRLPAVAGEWLESYFVVPASFITTTNTRFTLIVQGDVPYMPFYYWVYQGVVTQLVANSAPRATFGDVARLLDYEVTQTDVLKVKLRWQVLAREQRNYRIFIHLVNPADDSPRGIAVQHDTPPYEGTQPFWTWRENDIQTETLTLPLPINLAKGDYKLLLGIYDAETDERVKIINAKDFGENRFELKTITLK